MGWDVMTLHLDDLVTTDFSFFYRLRRVDSSGPDGKAGWAV